MRQGNGPLPLCVIAGRQAAARVQVDLLLGTYRIGRRKIAALMDRGDYTRAKLG
jgi:hypothetical protein